DRRRDRPAGATARAGGLGRGARAPAHRSDDGAGDGPGRPQAGRGALLAAGQARRHRSALPPAGGRRRMSHAFAVYRRLLPLMRPYVPVLLVGAALAIVVAAMEG